MATATVAADTTVDVGPVGQYQEAGLGIAIGGRTLRNSMFVRPDYRVEVLAQW